MDGGDDWVKQAGGHQGCVCVFRHASAPEVAYVHFKTNGLLSKVRVDDNGNPSLDPG